MDAKSPRLGMGPHFLDKPRFADSGLAAHIDDMPGAPAERSFKSSSELLEFGFAADESASIRARRGVARNAVEAPNTDRRIDSLELEVSDQFADTPAAERPKHAIG